MRSLFWTFSALVVISCFMATNLWRGLHAEREMRADLRDHLAEAVRREAEVVQAARVAADLLPVAVPVAPAPEYPAVASPAASATPPTDVPSIVWRDLAAEQAELWKDPEYRKARLAQYRAQSSRDYPGLAEELGLSADEESHVLDLLAHHDLEMNSTISFVDANDPEASRQMSNALGQKRRRRDEAIAAALGPNGAARWQQYQQGSAGRSQAHAMNTMLTQAGQPLTGAQLKSLIAAMIAEQQRASADLASLTRNVNVQDPVARAHIEPEMRRRQADASERMLAAVAPIVSARQLELMRAQIEQQDAMNRAFARARERAAAAQLQEVQ